MITHARTSAARFLGYAITVQHADRKTTRSKRSINGGIALWVPKTVIKAKTNPYLRRGKPAHRSQLVNEDDYTILNTFGAEYRGLVNYYLLAGDVYKLSRVRWVMETALLKTLACKHDSTGSKMAAHYKAKIETPDGIRTCFEARVERDGKKPLGRTVRWTATEEKKKRADTTARCRCTTSEKPQTSPNRDGPSPNRMPLVVNTSSNALENLPSRSLIKKVN